MPGPYSKTFQMSHSIQNRNKTWSLPLPLILPTTLPLPAELAFHHSYTSAFSPPQGLCTCRMPAWHTVPWPMNSLLTLGPIREATPHPQLHTPPALNPPLSVLCLSLLNLMSGDHLFCLLVWFLIVRLSYQLASSWCQGLPGAFPAVSLGPGTLSVLPEHVWEDWTEEGREGEREGGRKEERTYFRIRCEGDHHLQ